MTDSQSPEEGTRRVLPEFRVTGPQPRVKDEALSITLTRTNICIGNSTNVTDSKEKPQKEKTLMLIMKLKQRQSLKSLERTPLVGFFGKVSYLIGTINLNVTMGEPERLQTIQMEFAVVKSYSPYDVILGWTGLRSLRAVVSTIHSMIKFPTTNDIATLITKKETLHECQRMEEAQGPAMEGRITLPQIQHADTFAWTPADMTIIPRVITEHELKTYPHIEPRVRRKWSIDPDRRKVVKDEVAEWLKAGIVRKVRYPTWVANPVLVKKPDGSWRMCIDFEVLNKAYPKDLYPLPEIDWKIESLMGFK
ncbi:hypothetical protein Tco_1245870 [Tanacetum coccineum]